VSLQRSTAWESALPELQPARAKECNGGRPCLHAAVLSPAGRHPLTVLLPPGAQPEGLAPAPLRAGPGCRGFVQEIPLLRPPERGRMDRHGLLQLTRVLGGPRLGRQYSKEYCTEEHPGWVEPESLCVQLRTGARPVNTVASGGRMLSSCAHGNAWASAGQECVCHHPFMCSQPQALQAPLGWRCSSRPRCAGCSPG